MAVSFPACAHRVTVFGSTRNNAATSAGVNSLSCSNDPIRCNSHSRLVVEPPLWTYPLRSVRCSTVPKVPWASLERGVLRRSTQILRLGSNCGHPRASRSKRSHHPCPHAPSRHSDPPRRIPSHTSRSPSVTTRTPGSGRSSLSTRPRSGRASAGRGSTRMRRRTPRSRTCSTCLEGWPTRTRSPASTTEVARRSSSETLAATRHPSCCAHTGDSWRASVAVTSPRPTSGPTSPTWTSSRRPPGSPRDGPRRTVGRATRRSSPHTACSKVCARRRRTGGGRRPSRVGGSGSPASGRSGAGWSSWWRPTGRRR